jgi:hypothetical protein
MATKIFSETLIIEHCCNCGIAFAMPEDLQSRLKTKGGSFYCPNGHGQHYTTAENQRLQTELANAKRWEKMANERASRAEQEAEHFKASRNAYKGQLTRVKKQIVAGLCPCCDRRFPRLEEHMREAHPDFQPESA